MSFKLLLLEEGSDQTPGLIESWVEPLKEKIADVEIIYASSVGEALEVIGECDATFGRIVPELFERATNLKWIASPQAGPKAGYYFEALINSNVVVTNTREIFNEHISQHILMLVLAFSKGLPTYTRRQIAHNWEKGYDAVYLPDATAAIIGVGGIGAETAHLCAEFGMTVLAVDPRVAEPPKGVAELHRPEAMGSVLPRADFVIVTVPETPQTQRLFTLDNFKLMKRGAFFINIGRGATVVLDDLVKALEAGEIRGAGLDVYELEPMPADHPLWDMENVIMTPHIAAAGPYLDDRRTELFIDNCVRYSEGRELRNVVDKANWF